MIAGMKTPSFLPLLLVCFALSCTSTQRNGPTPSASAAGQTTVVWISIDGFRHDYVERFHPPFLSRLAKEGAFTNQETPIFPSLTYPNHAAQITGRTPDGSGIPSNAFYDDATGKQYYLPDESSLLRAEPIWVTAERQGVRTAVIDWPMSHAQTGEWTAEYYGQTFDKKEPDAHRLQRMVDTLKADHNAKPYRLVMSYVFNVDTVGHKYGPDSKEVGEAVLDVDAALSSFSRQVIEWFNATHSPNDQLYLLFTTDHGMEPINTTVNLDRLLGGDLSHGIKIFTSGPIATIHLNGLPEDERAARAQAIVDKLNTNSYLTAWKAADVPAKYHLSDPTRVGEVVVSLQPGYSLTSIRTGATEPSTKPTAQPLKGNHGYDPAVCPNMLGTAIVWSYRHPQGGHDLGVISNTQWAATVDQLLNISPAAGSDDRAVDVSR